MPAKTILVSIRKTKVQAEKLKKHIEGFGMIKGTIVEKNGVYEVHAKPSGLGKIYVGEVGSKSFASYVKIVQYGPDGEVI